MIRTHPVTKGMPASYLAPSNEWYQWKPSPRLNKNVKVLVTLDPSNYPIGVKDVITKGDMPIVWTNTKYRMLYMNQGHGENVFGNETQNKLFANAILWLGNRKNAAGVARKPQVRMLSNDVVSAGCGAWRALRGADRGSSEKHLLMIGEEKGYRHEAVSHAMATIERLGRESGHCGTPRSEPTRSR